MLRCAWVPQNSPQEEYYHDTEWGVPVHNDQTFFEFLTLEGAQAGLSWKTILLRRDGYRKAFGNFDPKIAAQMTDAELEACLNNPGIIRNRLKVYSVRKNAQAFLAIQQEFGSFDAYVWRFVGGSPIIRRPKTLQNIPAESDESRALGRDLKKRGMTFVGSTICYAFMQATGLVNDHMEDCFCSHTSSL